MQRLAENVLSHIGNLDASALSLLVQLMLSLMHFRPLSTDPSSLVVLRQSVIFVISKSESLQLECSQFIEAIDDFYQHVFKQFGAVEEKVLEMMKDTTLLSLCNSGAIKPKTDVGATSSGAQYMEIVVQSSPFQLSFRMHHGVIRTRFRMTRLMQPRVQQSKQQLKRH
jgi:hypothetical protein